MEKYKKYKNNINPVDCNAPFRIYIMHHKLGKWCNIHSRNCYAIQEKYINEWSYGVQICTVCVRCPLYDVQCMSYSVCVTISYNIVYSYLWYLFPRFIEITLNIEQLVISKPRILELCIYGVVFSLQTYYITY